MVDRKAQAQSVPRSVDEQIEHDALWQALQRGLTQVQVLALAHDELAQMREDGRQSLTVHRTLQKTEWELSKHSVHSINDAINWVHGYRDNKREKGH